MTTVYPPAVNLHPHRYECADQGAGTLQCGRYGPAEALDTAAQRAGAERGYSPSFLRWATDENRGLPPGDHSASLHEVADAIQRYGICRNADFNGYSNWSLQPGLAARLKAQRELPISMRPVVYRNEDPVETVKWYLCHGMVVLASVVNPGGWSAAVQYKPWRTHVIPANSSFSSSEHVIPIIGYEDDCKRFQFKNSFGSLWGDAGYGGLEYRHVAQGLDRLVYTLYVIDQCQYPLVKVEGFMPGIADFTAAEKLAMRNAKKAEWAGLVAAHMPPNPTSNQWIVDGLVANGLKARHLEIYMEAQAGTVTPAWVAAQGLTAPPGFFEPL